MTEKKLPLFPKATASWLIDNTALTFKQIANFCGLHDLEVRAMADGEIASSIIPINPIDNKQLTQEEIDRCTSDPEAQLEILRSPAYEEIVNKTKKSRYTPVSQRQDKPDAILWIVKNYPEIPSSQIVKLIGTTKKTIESIRDNTYWNIINLRRRDPVVLGLCTQGKLNDLIEKYNTEKSAKNAQN